MSLKTVIKRVKPWYIPVGLTLAFFILFRFVFFIGFVPSGSMEPTLPEGSIIIGSRIISEPKVGDIIVFQRDGVYMVKRIAAVPGNTLDLRELSYMENYPRPERQEWIITVPEDCYFVLGDNSNNSVDSRYWDDPYIKKESITAYIFYS